MPAKIFITGATGYIGGDALHAIAHAHPEYEIACLVRNSEKGAQIASQFSKVRLVYGDLDSVDVLETEAKAANVVLHCAHADHEIAAKALVKGLFAHPPDQIGSLIHTSGTGILMFADMERQIYGEASTKVYDDWSGIEEVTSLPDSAPHRNVDKIVLAAGMESEPKVRTAIVCPPTIYGKGRGPGNQRSQQMNNLTQGTLRKKQGFHIGNGKAHWTNIHVIDLSDCFLKLVEAALQGGGKATWGKEGYYFTQNGEHVWDDAAKWVASAAHKQGLIPSDEVISVTLEEARQLVGKGTALTLASNSRCKAIRAHKLLGWTPAQRSIEDETPELVNSEAKLLGLIEGHAAKVSG